MTGTPPTLSNAPAATFTFTDAEATVTFECRVDAASYQVCTSPHTYTGLAEGSHTFEVRAVDAAGNRSTPASHIWTVDTIAPATSVTFPATNASYNDAGYTSGCGTDAVGDICGMASDTGSGLRNVQISIRRGTGNYWDGTGFNSTTEVLLTPTGTANWSYALPATSFPAEGAYTVRVRATDNAGNVHTTTSSHTIDRTAPPVPTIVGKPSNTSNTKNPTFTFANSESEVTYECRIDGGTFTTCTTPYTYSGLPDGSHTVEVRSLDAAGNRSNAASYTWTIDTVAPTASITYPTAGAFYNNSTWLGGCGTATTGDFCGTAGDAHTGLATVRVGIQQGSGNYWNGTAFNSPTEVLFTPVGTTSWSYAFLAGNFPADGTYTVRAHVADTAGNVTVGSTTFHIDRTAPIAQDIQTTTAGTNGRPEANDTITFTYSETMAPGSILTGWNGSSTNVVVRITDGGGSNDVLTVWDTADTQRLSLGSVDLGRTDYVTKNVRYGLSGNASTMIQNAAAITVTLGTPNDTTALQTAAATGQMGWSTTGAGTDLAGNSGASTATESGPADKDF